MFAIAPAYAGAGDTVTVGTSGSPAHFYDAATGHNFGLILEGAQESPPPGGDPNDESENSRRAGSGYTTIGLRGLTRACSTHGPDPTVQNFGPGQWGGAVPFPDIGCGTAYGQTVAIQGCVAEIEAHGFVHSDHPAVNYMGATTIAVRYQKSRSGDQVKVTVYTPKEAIVLNGKMVNGFSSMPSCP